MTSLAPPHQVPLRQHGELPWCEIVLRNTPGSEHVSQIVTGLLILHAQGKLKFDQTRASPPAQEVRARGLLWLDVRLDHASFSVCFDMLDGADVNEDEVKSADFYFKRTYIREEHTRQACQRERILPFGLNFACGFTNRSKMTAHTSLGRVLRVISHFRAFGVRKPGSALNYKSFEVSSMKPARTGIVFLTRLWTSENVPAYSIADLEALNQSRIELIEFMKKVFGQRFTGGLQDDEVSRRHAASLVYSGSTNKVDYIRLMQSQLVGIASTGLHRSTGWKFAEYLAASRCIVSEPITHDTLGSLAEDTHYLSFSQPEECAQKCEALLTHPHRALSIRQANERYYHQYVRPDAAVRRCLIEAIQRLTGQPPLI